MAQGSTRGVPIDIDATLALDSDLVVPSQKAIKTYVDNGLALKQGLLGYTPVNKAGDTMIGDLILNADPTYALQAATKKYVDENIVAGIQLHDPVRAESTGNLNATYANGGTTPTITAIAGNNTLTSTAHGLSINDVIVFNTTANGLTAGTPYFIFSTPSVDTFTLSLSFNGVQITTLTNGTGLTLTSRANSGVGATLTNAGTQAALVIDGITMAVNDRVLVRLQTSGAQNGVYVVSNIGSGSTNWVLTRATDSNKYAPKDPNRLGEGDYYYTTSGTLNAGDSHILNSSGTIVFGTTLLSFAQFSGAVTYSGGTNIDVTGQIISLTGQVAVANGGTGASTLTGVLIGNGTSPVTGITGTSSQLLRRNVADTAYEFFTPSYILLTSLSATSPLNYDNTTGAFSITQSSGSQNGYLSSTDWTTFNNKQNAITLTTTGTTGAATFVGATLNIPQYQGQITLTTTGTSGAATLVGNTLNIPQYQSVLTNPVTGTGTINEIAYFTATGSTIGSLSTTTYPSLTEISYVKGVTSAIQTQLNSKQATITLTTTGNSGAATFISNTLNIPNYTLSGLGGVPTNRTLTINSITYDLSADRSWTIGPTIYSRGLQRFVATAGQTTFTITNGYTVGLVDVYRNGVKLDNSAEFTASNGTTVVLTDAAALNDIIEVYKYGSEYIPNNALRTVNTFTATAAQTTFSVTYSVGLLDVFYNGSKLAAAEYTATNGTSVIFANACTAGDIIEIIAYNYLVNAYAGISGSGNNNYIPKFTSASTIGNSSIQDNGTTITLGAALSGTSATFSGIVGVNGATEAGWALKSNGNLKVENSNGTTVLQVNDTSTGGKTWSLISAGAGNVHSIPAGTFYLRNSSDSTTAFQIASTGAATFSVASGVYTAVNATSPNTSVYYKLTPTGGDSYYVGAGVTQTNDFSIYNVTRSKSYLTILGGATGGGKVGINWDSPASQLSVKWDRSTAFSGIGVYDSQAYNASNHGGTITFGGIYNSSNVYTEWSGIGGNKSNTTDGNVSGDINFYTRLDSSAMTERMCIKSGGQVVMTAGISSSAASSATTLTLYSTTSTAFSSSLYCLNSSSTNCMFVRGDGYGYLLASAWAYGSDLRMKENIKDVENGIDMVLKMKPKHFDYIDGTKDNLGFIAQDVQEIIPQAVSVSDEATGMLALKTDFLLPYLTKAIQEQQAQIEQLKAKLN